MANNVIVQVLGGKKEVFDNVETITDVKLKLQLPNHTGIVNGDSETDSHQLVDGDFISLAPAVKGGV